MTKKTAILIRCTEEEAQQIRQAAAMERRTLSGYILNAVMNRIKIRSQMIPAPEARPMALGKRKVDAD